MNDDDLEAVTSRVYRAGTVDGLGELSAAISLHAPDSSSARSLAVSAGASLVRYKLGQDVTDLVAALDSFEQAHAIEESPSRAANIAAALLELNDVPDPDLVAGRPERHVRAIELLRWAISQADPASDAWVTRSTTMTGALLDAVARGIPGASIDALLDSADQTVVHAGSDLSRGAEPLNLLGSAHLLAADQGHPRADLDRAVEALQRSVALTAVEHLDRPARLANLASALLDRYERIGRVEDLQEAAEQQRLAAELLGPSDARLGQLTNNLANTLRAIHQRTGTYADLLALRAVLDDLISAFEPAHPEFAPARSNAGLIATDVASILDDADLLEAGIRFHIEAVEATPESHPQYVGRLASLAVALMRRYDREHREEDLDTSLAIGQAVLADPRGPDHERAIFLSTQGSARHEAFLRRGTVRDLEAATVLHREALAYRELHGSNPFVPAMLNNAAVALTDRYDRLGEIADIEDAVAALEESLALSGDLVGADLVGRLNNLVLALLQIADLQSDGEVAQRALTVAEEAVLAADSGTSAGLRLIAWGTLLDALRRAERQSGANLSSIRRRSGEAWQSIVELFDDVRPAAQGRWLLRAALRSTAPVSAVERRQLIKAAIEASIDSRPHVALSAARQLAMDALHDQANDKGDGADVEEAADVVDGLSRTLRTRQDHLRHALSWQNELTGFWSLVAHSRLLRGDVDAAVRAQDDGHGVLLSEALSVPTIGAASGAIVTVWTTDLGGAAVVRRAAADHVTLLLPGFTTERVAGWVRVLRKASLLGESVLRRTLGRISEVLGAELVGPVSDVLYSGEPVLWASAGSAALLPVGCAPISSGMPLAAAHVLRTAPTARIGAWADNEAAARASVPGPWMSFAAPAPSSYPELNGTLVESRAFAGGDHSYVADRCTRAGILDGLGKAGLLHLAMHARMTARDPLMNHLVTSGDHPLFAQDILTAASTPRLAILSACDTASPGTMHADEGLGLAGAFLASGVPGVIASTWSVGDLGSSWFMQLVAERLKDGQPPDHALSTAVVAAERASAPRTCWAGFALIGA